VSYAAVVAASSFGLSEMHKSYKAMHKWLTALLTLVTASVLLIVPPSALAGEAKANETKMAADPSYLIQAGDVLIVSVWKEPDLQGEVLVRPDGGLSFPLAGDLHAAGKTVTELQANLASNLKKYIPDPVVTIGIKLIGGNRIYVLGKVNRPGEFPLSRPLDVMQALSLAGGATPFADLNDVRVLRRDGDRQTAIRFRYNDVEQGRRLEQNILLKSGDTVVVP
jgi:polysaccharide biosynthesis/export protein